MHSNESSVPVPPGVTNDYLRYHRVCPAGLRDDGTLQLLVAPDALLSDAVPELELAYGIAVHREETSWRVISEAIANLGRDEGDLANASAPDELDADLRDLASQPPVIRYVNAVIRDAVEGGASDVHLEAIKDGAVARLRIDGVLTGTSGPPPQHRQAVISRLKLLAGLDIAEHRIPQDGRIRVRLATRELDIRVSTVPSMHGESVVLRLLEQQGRPTMLDDLGLHERMHADFVALVRRPHGLLLVTGPTGSGKTTTLYAALHCRNLRAEKVITVEDPIEYQLADVVQVPVNRVAGMTFPSALRSLLRQDPDVVMVGEMRDRETAEVAVQAALTGHQVLSTLHTNDAVSAIPRLVDLGVAPYLVAATLDGVLAQRLVRRNCQHCLEQYTPSTESLSTVDAATLGDGTYYRGAGCSRCRGTGYRGRLGIFELLHVSELLREAIVRGDSRAALRHIARATAPADLRSDGLRHVANRQTTIEEVHRAALA